MKNILFLKKINSYNLKLINKLFFKKNYTIFHYISWKYLGTIKELYLNYTFFFFSWNSKS